MQNIKGWISSLKPFSPRVVSVSDPHTMVRNISMIGENTRFQRGILYVGMFKDVEYRLRTAENMAFVLVADPGVRPDRRDCGGSTVIVLSEDADIDQVYDTCRQYLQIQEEVTEKKQRMMDVFLAVGNLQCLLDELAGIIGFPMMIIDNSYCLVGASSVPNCDDPLWMNSIRDGYCSYEFVSRFTQLSEIEVTGQDEGPVLAGCMMSPMRRCIVRMTSDKHPIGYLISIESTRPFDRIKVELLELAARMLSRFVAYVAMESGVDLVHATWDAIINAIEQTPKSDLILREFLLNAGLRKDSNYYIILFSLTDPEEYHNRSHSSSLNDLVRSVFSFCAFSYYKKDVIVIVDYRDGDEALLRLLSEHLQDFTRSSIYISVSDMFSDFSNIRRYYEQAKQAQTLMKRLDKDMRICSYETVRVYDMLSASCGGEDLPLYMRKKEIELYEYDQEHGTEFFRTLYSYIKNSRRLQDVSDELHIHKNTVSYRINRIRELLDIDFNDAQTRTGFYLAYHVLTLRGWRREGDDE